MDKSDRNGWIRVGLIAPTLTWAVLIDNPAPVFLGIIAMLIFQLANGEGLE